MIPFRNRVSSEKNRQVFQTRKEQFFCKNIMATYKSKDVHVSLVHLQCFSTHYYAFIFLNKLTDNKFKFWFYYPARRKEDNPCMDEWLRSAFLKLSLLSKGKTGVVYLVSGQVVHTTLCSLKQMKSNHNGKCSLENGPTIPRARMSVNLKLPCHLRSTRDEINLFICPDKVVWSAPLVMHPQTKPTTRRDTTFT
jgi:hypothetical protein